MYSKCIVFYIFLILYNPPVHYHFLSQRYYVGILLYCLTLVKCGMAAPPLEAQ